MSDLYRDGGSTVRVTSPIRHASGLADATPPMPFLPKSSSYRIQRWIGDQDSNPFAVNPTPKPRDSEEAQARQQHDHLAELDWELEEFEREMALRFVMRDLQLGLEERRGRNPITSTRPDTDQHKRSLTPWLRTQSSTATLQPFTQIPETAPSSPPSQSLSPTQSSYPPTPRTPTLSCVAPPTTPASPELPPHSARPGSLLGLLRPPPSHKPSPSVLSLSSHFSSCTSSASHDADTEPEAEAAPSISARSLVSHFGQKIKHGFLAPPPLPSSPYTPKAAAASTILELTPSGAIRKKRRVSVPVSLGPKKRRLVVRGIKMDDDYAVEGVRRWACSLGEVSRICRAQDGTIWIEFRDKRVAESVCCLQAQVQIPHVGRVVLDWAEGRHPG